MLLIAQEKVNTFSKKHADARKALATWQIIAEQASWKNKMDVLADFPKAKIIANSRARFEIAHNTYRLIVYIDYDNQLVQIRFIGTHSEYDRIDPAMI